MRESVWASVNKEIKLGKQLFHFNNKKAFVMCAKL